jgi:hypothetical protein
MKIAVHILAYNVSRFIRTALKNTAPHVDKIYVAYPKRPWNYTESSRAAKLNPTAFSEFETLELGTKIEVLQGDWMTEESMREECFTRAKAEGFDWLLIQDADELYEEKCWRQIRDKLERSASTEHFTTTWYNFWKSSQYVLQHPSGEIKGTNAGFAVRCLPHLHFTEKRLTNAASTTILDIPCHHYGYVMSDSEMEEKLTTWGHSHETNPNRWFRLKWRNWRESTRYLHPVSPPVWTRAIRWPYVQPDFAEEFALDVAAPLRISVGEQLEEIAFNWQGLTDDSLRRFKRRVRLALG